MGKTRGAVALVRWLEENRYSQIDLAEMVGVRQTSVSLWKRGAQPAVKYAVAIARITGIPVEWWTEDADNEQERPTGT